MLPRLRNTANPRRTVAWNRRTEAACLLSAAALFLLFANWSTFTTPFFAENFQYLGPYQHLSNCLLCTLTTPTLDGWFRPVDAFWSVVSFQVLGLDPLTFHLRNYLLLLGNLIVLQQFLWEVVPARAARMVAVAFVTVSRFNFTTIGYINNFGGILEATWVLLAVFLLVRFIKHGGGWRYGLAIAASILCIFTKETGISVFFVLAALVLALAEPTGRRLGDLRRWAIYLAPVGLAVVALFVIRSIVAGSPVQTTPVYSPGFSLPVLARDSVAFVAALGNVGLVEPSTMGNGGVAALVASRFGLGQDATHAADGLVLVALAVLLGSLWHNSVSRPRLWVLPLAWMGVVLGMVIGIRNLQLYYTYDFVLAFAVLLAMLLAGAGRSFQLLAGGAVVVIAANGLVSNATSTYAWEHASQDAGEGTSKLAVLCSASTSCDHLVLVTSQRDYWRYTLGAAPPSAPMLPELLHRPNLQIDYVSPVGLSAAGLVRDPGTLLVDIDHGWRPAAAVPAAPAGKPTILSFGPAQVQAGRLFNVQPNGESGLWFEGFGFTPQTVVVFAGTPLETTVSPQLDLVTATVGPDLYARPGRYSLYLWNAAGDSTPVELDVIP